MDLASTKTAPEMRGLRIYIAKSLDAGKEERNSNDNNEGGGSNWYPATLLFLSIYRCQKSIWETSHSSLPLRKKFLYNISPSQYSIWVMCITQAGHFRRVLLLDEIQRLRGLMREGSPERISRS